VFGCLHRQAAAVGTFGGAVLAAIYRFIGNWRESRNGKSADGVLWKTTKQMGNIVKDRPF
jgi:hypothetical protein